MAEAERFERPARHRAVRALHGHRGALDGRTIRRLPAPFAAIVVELADRPCWRGPDGEWRSYPRLALHGLMTVWSEGRFAPRAEQDCLMVLLEPWAVRALTGLDPAASVDTVLDLENLRPRWSVHVLQRLRRAAEPGDRLRLLEQSLGEAVDGDPPAEIAHFMAAARSTAGAVRLEESGLGGRAFRGAVRAWLGMPPKRWCVLERFSANLVRLHPQPWPEARSAEPDYFDQAHEIGEFRRLAGVTPGVYRRAKAAGDPRLYALG